MKSKTLILQSQLPNSSGRGILTLSFDNDLLSAKLRLYNFPKLDAFAKLGVYHQSQVYSSNLLFKDGAYTSSLVGDFDINTDFYCAIVDTANNNQPLLAGGTYAGFYFDDTSVITNNLNKTFSPNPIVPDAEPTARETACLDPQPAPAREPSAPTQQNKNCNLCAKCKYKEFFYTQNPTQPQNTALNTDEQMAEPAPQAATSNQTCKQSTPNTTAQTDTRPSPSQTIIESLVPQFDYIFKTFPECTELNTRIANSRFVTISENNSTYCLGAIYEADNLKYICYAVPANYNAPIPEELGEHHQWLPLDPEDPLSDGYHIVYQDAHDLKIIEV